MSKPETLHDKFYQKTFLFKGPGAKPMIGMRQQLVDAVRMVLNTDTSGFLIDLWTQSPDKKISFIDGMRRLARIPHRKTWIEFDVAARNKRAEELGVHNIPRLTNVMRAGWLLEQAETDDTSFKATWYVETDSGELGSLPYSYVWSSGDSPPVFRMHNTDLMMRELSSAGLAVGISNFPTKYVGLARGLVLWPMGSGKSLVWPDVISSDDAGQLRGKMSRCMGELPLLWVLLATINDLPIIKSEVRSARGFMAKHSYHKYLDHVTVTLHVPEREYRKVAKRAIAASRRRAHQVRGHWRKDWRHAGERIWVREHQRGDAALGFVTHDYRIEHTNLPN
jgi:hypothetical protein